MHERLAMGFEDKVLILASGGIDSTALIDFYLKEKIEVECIFFDYGQPARDTERESVSSVTSHYRVNLHVFILPFSLTQRNREYLGRNALFILAAASIMGSVFNRIAIGINASSHYYDCSPMFITEIQPILDGYFAGSLILEAPFQYFIKSQIIEYCRNNRVPIEKTYSCLLQNAPACGKCESCIDRREYLGTL